MELISRRPGSRRALIGYLYTNSCGDDDEDAGYAWAVVEGSVELERKIERTDDRPTRELQLLGLRSLAKQLADRRHFFVYTSFKRTSDVSTDGEISDLIQELQERIDGLTEARSLEIEVSWIAMGQNLVASMLKVPEGEDRGPKKGMYETLLSYQRRGLIPKNPPRGSKARIYIASAAARSGGANYAYLVEPGGRQKTEWFGSLTPLTAQYWALIRALDELESIAEIEVLSDSPDLVSQFNDVRAQFDTSIRSLRAEVRDSVRFKRSNLTVALLQRKLNPAWKLLGVADPDELDELEEL